MRHVQVIPRQAFNLYGELVRKEADLRRRSLGTWRRSGKKTRDRARWIHSRYSGYIKIARGMGEVVQIEVRSDVEWQLLDAILGFLDRHFGDEISSIHIFYEE
ncbi:MAG: hypothetical protein ACE5HT_14650 [Gemmatimonadales bacterium]